MADAQTQNQKQQEGPRGPARIKLSLVDFRESQDFPGGNSLAWQIDCGPQKAKGRQFFVGWFIPAWQVIELEWYADEKTKPRRFMLPMALIKRFE